GRMMRRAAPPFAVALLLAFAGCAHKTAMTHTSAPVAADLMSNPKAVKEAQHALDALGYAAGRADGVAGPGTIKAIRAFQKDQKLAVDGKLTVALAEKLKAAEAKLSVKSAAALEP